ncbi:hypothetical protein GCM10025867_20630 [Frondihabitans sucicola]|uniref:Uncharacterized protein n=1 Tax=Frondihabitans sucicola TaxID=1268041 RepID=A0ABN6XXS7_9MICO|nr:hypothetical protein [Frondihabitans sucicola]BDZ49822.1 hypothetical protein GCM10025867_20630 [Frondihabitans sucicola]
MLVVLGIVVVVVVGAVFLGNSQGYAGRRQREADYRAMGDRESAEALQRMQRDIDRGRGNPLF